LGNAILVGSPSASDPDWGPVYIMPNNYSVLDHEEQHTYQGQLLGPLYLLANALGGLFLWSKLRADLATHGILITFWRTAACRLHRAHGRHENLAVSVTCVGLYGTWENH